MTRRVILFKMSDSDQEDLIGTLILDRKLQEEIQNWRKTLEVSEAIYHGFLVPNLFVIKYIPGDVFDIEEPSSGQSASYLLEDDSYAVCDFDNLTLENLIDKTYNNGTVDVFNPSEALSFHITNKYRSSHLNIESQYSFDLTTLSEILDAYFK